MGFLRTLAITNKKKQVSQLFGIWNWIQDFQVEGDFEYNINSIKNQTSQKGDKIPDLET